MKYFKILACVAIFFYLNKTYSQNKQNFTEYFTTSSGISGKVYLSTKPVTLSWPYIVIQADKIIVTSVSSSSGTIRGNELADFGINLPFECTNGGFYVSGSVSWKAYGTVYYDSADFKTGGRVTLGSSLGNTNQEIKFSQAQSDRHKEGVKAGLGSLWEKTGKVLSVNISNVSGADFGMILNAVNKYTKRKADELALNNKIKTIERSIHSYPKNTSELEYNLEKYQELASISDDSKYDDKMEQIRKRIEEIRKQEAAKTQNDKIVDSDSQKSNTANTENSNETTENSSSSSSSKRSKLDEIEKEKVTSNSDANYEARKFEMEQRFRDQKRLNNANYYTRNGDFLSAMVELNQVSGYNYREAQNEIKKIQYQALGQFSKQSIKRLEKYTNNVNFDGKDANEVLSEYSKKYNYVVSQFNESKSNVVDKTVSITAQRVGEKVGQGDNVGAVADGVMGIITATSAAKQANEARERAIRELKFKRDNNLRGLRDKLVNEYSSASNYYYGKALNSMNVRNENIALNNYNYYQCRLNTINEKFSYENGNWAKNGSCSIPKESKINSENTSYDNYEVSKRKFYIALEFPENSKERKDFLAAAELTLGKLPTSHTSDRKINDLTTALVLASNSKKFTELKKEVLSDFLLPMDSNNSAKINSLYRFLNFLENPKKSVKENIPEFAYTTIDLNSESIDWTALGNRYVINFENHVRPKLDALKSDLKNLKSLSEKELENLNKAKGYLDKNKVYNPKLNNYIRALESNISSSNALDLAKKKIYNNVVFENFNSIKHEYVENEQKREYVIANMLEELPNIENENFVEKISYEVINDKKNSVGKLNGLEYTLLEKLSCLCDKNMLFDSLLKKTVGSLKKTREERVNLLLFMAQNYSAFNRCSQDEIKERFKLIASYGIEKLVDIREIHYKLRPKISNNQTIINRNGDKFLITKRIL